MPARPKKPEYPKTIIFENGRVRISKRGDGKFALAWTEGGGLRKTTITDEGKALEFAAKKARLINAGTLAEWVTPADADALRILHELAGDGESGVRRLLMDVKAAKGWLQGGEVSLAEAARFYAEKGPLRVEQVTLVEAVERFLKEYEPGPTKETLTKELMALVDVEGGMRLMDLGFERLNAFVRRPMAEGVVKRMGWERMDKGASKRTIHNRMSSWVTFMNRCRAFGLLPQNAEHAGQLLKKPVLAKKGVVIFSIEEVREMLRVVREEGMPRMEAFLLIGCWLGLRPSECVRVRMGDFDFERGYLHVTHEVARKLEEERYVPMDPRVAARLQVLFEEPIFHRGKSGRVCVTHTQEDLSVLVRGRGIIERWAPDVTRHSYISYRLALIQDIGRVAEEAGNSPEIIRKVYKRPLRPEEGVAWWQVLEEF